MSPPPQLSLEAVRAPGCTKARLLTFRTRASGGRGRASQLLFIPLSFAAGGQWTCWWRRRGRSIVGAGGKRGSGRGDLCVLLSSHPSSLRSSAAFQRCAVMLGKSGRNLLSSVMLNHTGARTLSRTRVRLAGEASLLRPGWSSLCGVRRPQGGLTHMDGMEQDSIKSGQRKVICQFSGCERSHFFLLFVFYLEGFVTFIHIVRL